MKSRGDRGNMGEKEREKKIQFYIFLVPEKSNIKLRL